MRLQNVEAIEPRGFDGRNGSWSYAEHGPVASVTFHQYCGFLSAFVQARCAGCPFNEILGKGRAVLRKSPPVVHSWLCESVGAEKIQDPGNHTLYGCFGNQTRIVAILFQIDHR